MNTDCVPLRLVVCRYEARQAVLRAENEALRASILGGSADQAGGSKDDVHFAWMHRVLNSGRNFEGSVCGNSWSSDYRPMFFESF